MGNGQFKKKTVICVNRVLVLAQGGSTLKYHIILAYQYIDKFMKASNIKCKMEYESIHIAEIRDYLNEDWYNWTSFHQSSRSLPSLSRREENANPVHFCSDKELYNKPYPVKTFKRYQLMSLQSWQFSTLPKCCEPFSFSSVGKSFLALSIL